MVPTLQNLRNFHLQRFPDTEQTHYFTKCALGLSWSVDVCLSLCLPPRFDPRGTRAWGRKFAVRGPECGSREAGSYEEEPCTGAEVLGEYTSSCSHTPRCFNTRARVQESETTHAQNPRVSFCEAQPTTMRPFVFLGPVNWPSRGSDASYAGVAAAADGTAGCSCSLRTQRPRQPAARHLAIAKRLHLE